MSVFMRRSILVFLFIALLMPAIPVAAIGTGVVTVTTTTDSTNGCATSGSAPCSLRDPVTYANAHADTTINFQLGLGGIITLGSTLYLNTSMTITGPGANLLAVDGVNAPVTSAVPDGTALTATLLAHLPGNITASVSEPAFAPAPATTTLTYVNFTPAVQSISPPSGPLTGGASVTITGAYFAPGASVNFGSTLAQNVTIVSDAKITATTPARSASGAVNVSVTVQGLIGTLTNGYTYGIVLPIPPVQPTGAPVSGTTSLPVARPAGQASGGSPPAPLPAPRP